MNDIWSLVRSAAHLLDSLNFLVEKEQSLIDFGISVKVRFLDMLRKIGDYSGFNFTHLSVNFTCEVVEIFSYLAKILRVIFGHNIGLVVQSAETIRLLQLLTGLLDLFGPLRTSASRVRSLRFAGRVVARRW